MTYAFIIVVSVAISLKLLFLSFSLYFTFKNKDPQVTQTIGPRGENKKSMNITWRQIQHMFLRKTLYVNPDVNKSNSTNKP